MLKKAVQMSLGKQRPEAYPLGYVEGLRETRTSLVDYLSILLYSDSLHNDHTLKPCFVINQPVESVP